MTIRKYIIEVQFDETNPKSTTQIEITREILVEGLKNNNEGIWLFLEGYYKAMKEDKN